MDYSLRQLGSIPTAAESLNQLNAGRHPPGHQVRCGAFIREGNTLRRENFQIRCDTTLYRAVERSTDLLGRGHSDLLRRQLLIERRATRQGCPLPAERPQARSRGSWPTVGFMVVSRLLSHGPSPSPIEDRLNAEPPTDHRALRSLETAFRWRCSPILRRLRERSADNRLAVAIPICALAEATLRSAAAMSGRRSRSSDGTPSGICGGDAVRGAGGIEKVDAFLPLKTAMRVQIVLALRQLRCPARAWSRVAFRLCNIHIGGNAPVITGLRQLATPFQSRSRSHRAAASADPTRAARSSRTPAPSEGLG